MIRIDNDSIRALLEETSESVLSLYVPVDPSDANNQKSPGSEAWRIWLKNELKRLEDSVSRDGKAAWNDAREALERFLADYSASGRTLVCFVRPAGHVFTELPVRLEPAAAFGKPEVSPLLQAMDEHHHYLVALVAANGYRIVTGYMGFVGEVARVELDRNWDMQGTIRRKDHFSFEAHRDHHQRSYQQGLATDIDKVLFDNPEIDRIVLGGSEKEAHGVRSLMHPKAAESVVAVLPIPIDSAEAQILERVEPVAIAYERDRESALVDQVIEMTRAGGRASIGRDDVTGLLERGTVRTLILAAPQKEPLEPLLRLAYYSSSRVEFVHGEPAERLRAQGGVAAELYYG